MTSAINDANTAYVLICALLVFFMIPGLGFFYAGLDRKKYVLTMVMQSLVSIPITALIWIFWGFGLAFGPNINDSLAGGLIGNPTTDLHNLVSTESGQVFKGQGNSSENWLLWKVAFDNGQVTIWNNGNGVPTIVFFIYQLMFAAITPALMTGAFADRMTWGKYIVFNILWQYLVYIPVCHWIWGGGFLSSIGVLDWAGGIVIHTTAGFGGIVAVLILGRRKGLGGHVQPISPILVMLGIAFLWFGWFGFNSGGGMGIMEENSSGNWVFNDNTIFGFINTALAPCFAMVTWMILEWITHHRKMSAVSVAGSFVAGLAGITPAAGYVPIQYGFVVGVAVAIVGFVTLGVVKKSKRIDDAMDVFSVHGVTGFSGAILIGAFIPKSLLGTTLSFYARPTLGINTSSSTGYLLGNVANSKKLGDSLLSTSSDDFWRCYQVAVELGAAALAAGWAFVLTALILWFVIGASKIFPGSLKTYRSSFEEENEDLNPIDSSIIESPALISQHSEEKEVRQVKEQPIINNQKSVPVQHSSKEDIKRIVIIE